MSIDHWGQGPRVCAAGLGRDHGWVSAMSVVRSGSRACGYSVRPLQSVESIRMDRVHGMDRLRCGPDN
jgi:hypothetical protein